MKILLIFTLLLISSCKEEAIYDKVTIMGMAKELDPKIIEVLPESIDKGVQCSTYGAGCVGAFVVRTSMVEFIMVRFEQVDMARRKATELGGYYSRNWFFDEVRGEPVLEDFVLRAFKAKRGDHPQVKIKKGRK